MLNENSEETIIQQQSVEKRNLMKKYDISLEKLSFEYIKTCTNVKELEKIVKILRSGEEGYYEQLQKQAEERLHTLAPSSRILRTEEPLVMKESLLASDRHQLDNDMKEWVDEISKKDVQLSDWNKNHTSGSGDYLPPIRRGVKKENNSKSVPAPNNKKLKKPIMSDYATWDKYDAESELVKMEADEERKKEEDEINDKKRKAALQAEVKSKERGRLNDIIRTAQTLPDAEKSCLAGREKDRGNEYYRTCNYEEAIVYYTASIAICPNALAFNNRAASFLKQGKYDLALKDVNKCLNLDPGNTKGLYRRGLCLQHKNRFDEALEDMQTVLRKEPHNLLVQHVAKELRHQCTIIPRSVRMLVENHQEDKVVQVTETEAKRMKGGFEVNEWGLARTVCGCVGRPQFLNRPSESIAEHLIYKPDDDNCKKMRMLSEELKGERIVEKKVDLPLIEPLCNGNFEEAPVEMSRIAYKSSDPDNQVDDDSIPVKIKVIETVKLNSEKEESSKRGVVVKDMRGQPKHVHGQKQSADTSEQLGSMKIEEIASTVEKNVLNSAARSEVKNRKHAKQKNHQQIEDALDNDSNKKEQLAAGSEANQRTSISNYSYMTDCHTARKPIAIATKFTTKKVTSAKNANKHTSREEAESHNDTKINYSMLNGTKDTPNVDAKEKQITPFQFFQTWFSIKDSTSCLKEYANILRRISPTKLHSILGNKLDDGMLAAMVKSLANEFDVANGEGELVKQYLVSISNVDRFQIVVEFLSNDVKQLICGLIDKVGGDEALKKSYLV